ncbi:peptidyl-prolyl cis-trans isomerase Pin1 [Spatholobus suberectus]|nr:peptidyl-prolyl cis-trans isomerase Pin1 [Spatholobus suberectus]
MSLSNRHGGGDVRISHILIKHKGSRRKAASSRAPPEKAPLFSLRPSAATSFQARPPSRTLPLASTIAALPSAAVILVSSEQTSLQKKNISFYKKIEKIKRKSAFGFNCVQI